MSKDIAGPVPVLDDGAEFAVHAAHGLGCFGHGVLCGLHHDHNAGHQHATYHRQHDSCVFSSNTALYGCSNSIWQGDGVAQKKKANTLLILVVLALLGLFLLNRTRQAAAPHPPRIAH